MQAELKHLSLDPDPASLPDDPAAFTFEARMIVGPLGSEGEESFDVTVCSPECLAARCRESGGIYDPRHHLIVDAQTFDRRAVEAWLHKRVSVTEGASWGEIGAKLSRLGYWEFEDYRP